MFTPPAIARWMTAWACAHRPRRVLEPAVGAGVFVDAIEALAARDSAWRPDVSAFEIDGELRRAFGDAERGVRVALSEDDFVLSRDRTPFGAIVANPPYVRHHHLDYDESVYRQFDAQIGARLGRMTNLYGLFLLRIVLLLDANGRAAIITPAEWLNADFGAPLKRYLLRENVLDGLIVFADESLVFEGALTTAAIVLLRRGRKTNDAVGVEMVDDVDSLVSTRYETMRTIERAALDPARKWRHLFGTGQRTASESDGIATLADVADCMRGIATGANDFFTLTEAERRAAGIDPRDLTSCITRAAHAPRDTFDDADVERLIARGRKVWLLDPRKRIAPAVSRYLERGQAAGIPDRYLPAHRPVWFRPEKRPPAPIWAPVFVRGRFRFIGNTAGARNLTAFHGIYPRRTDPDASAELLAYLRTDNAQEAIAAQSRVYGGGLRKLEPRDVLAMPIPESLRRSLTDQ